MAICVLKYVYGIALMSENVKLYTFELKSRTCVIDLNVCLIVKGSIQSTNDCNHELPIKNQ